MPISMYSTFYMYTISEKVSANVKKLHSHTWAAKLPLILENEDSLICQLLKEEEAI